MHRTARTILLGLVVVLLVFGVIMLYSTSYAVFGEAKLQRQLGWITIGLIAALVVRRLDYRRLGTYSPLLLTGMTIVLAYLAGAFVLYHIDLTRPLVSHMPLIGGPIKGSFRWLRFGPASIQPSEFAKPILILFLADYFNRHGRHLHEFKRGFLVPVGIAGTVMVLILLGGSLSTTAITGAVVGTLCFVAGVRLRYLALLLLAGALAFAAIVSISPERLSRLTTYRTPEKYQRNDGYQLWMSQLALGSGGWRGLGFTNSRMKQRYLPEAHTDFIISIVGEELGFLSVMGLLLAYLLLVGSACWVAALAPVDVAAASILPETQRQLAPTRTHALRVARPI